MTKIHDSKSYKSARLDLIHYMDNPNKVLDIGCNTGSTGFFIKNKFGSDVFVMGIDYNQLAINESEKKIDLAKVVNLNNLDEFKESINAYKFDHIFIGDVLEHLLYPKEIVALAFDQLNQKGRILISLPNTGFYPTLFHLLNHKWPRNSRGIYDHTHLNIYLSKNLRELTPKNGTFKLLQRKYRWRESKGTKPDFLLKLLNYIPYIRNFFTFQFLIEISKE